MSETEWEIDWRCKESSDMKGDYWKVKRKKNGGGGRKPGRQKEPTLCESKERVDLKTLSTPTTN